MLLEPLADSLEDVLWGQESSVRDIIYNEGWEETRTVGVPLLGFLAQDPVLGAAMVLIVETIINAVLDIVEVYTDLFHGVSGACFGDTNSAVSVHVMNVFPPLLVAAYKTGVKRTRF